MSKLLANLSGVVEPAFSIRIKSLEKLSGRVAIDNSLTGMLLAGRIGVLRELGLDPVDTTAEEFYNSVLSAGAALEKSFLAKLIQSDDQNAPSVEKLCDTLAQYVEDSIPKSTVIAIKKVVLTRILGKCPPKVFMKMSGYSTVGSLLKHFSVYEVIGWSKCFEPKKWHDTWRKETSKLLSKDFTEKKVEIISAHTKYIDQKPALGLLYPAVLPVYEAGAVIVLVPEGFTYAPGLGLLLGAHLGDAVQELFSIGLYVRLVRTNRNIMSQLSSIFAGEEPQPIVIQDSIEVTWATTWKMLSGIGNDLESMHVGTYISEEDTIFWSFHDIIATFVKNKSLFGANWFGCEINGKVITLNISDIAYNIFMHKSIQTQRTSGLQRDLNAEVLYRYLAHEPLKSMFFDELDKLTLAGSNT